LCKGLKGLMCYIGYMECSVGVKFQKKLME